MLTSPQSVLYSINVRPSNFNSTLKLQLRQHEARFSQGSHIISLGITDTGHRWEELMLRRRPASTEPRYCTARSKEVDAHTSRKKASRVTQKRSPTLLFLFSLTKEKAK